MAMFPYDAALITAFRREPQTVAQVLETMTAVESICADGDGLKWFNWLYLRVTRAVEARIVAAGGFADPPWLAELDVQFARLYFRAIEAALLGKPSPGCWLALTRRRNESSVARIQFALAGINAHINHDLPIALVATYEATGTAPQMGDRHYNDYTALNSTFESLIDAAKVTLRLRLLGDGIPSVSRLENTIAGWKVGVAREAAWQNSALLWHLRPVPPLTSAFLSNLDGLTTVAGKALLVSMD